MNEVEKTELTEEDYETFNYWVFMIDDRNEELEELAEEHGIDLDFSETCPEALEQLALALDLRDTEEHNPMINDLGKYLGEYFRKTFGGSWYLGDDPVNDSLNFNQPLISHFNIKTYSFNPVQMVRNFAYNRRPNLFHDFIEDEKTRAHLHRKKD
jgi:hypothetical protein